MLEVVRTSTARRRAVIREGTVAGACVVNDRRGTGHNRTPIIDKYAIAGRGGVPEQSDSTEMVTLSVTTVDRKGAIRCGRVVMKFRETTFCCVCDAGVINERAVGRG